MTRRLLAALVLTGAALLPALAAPPATGAQCQLRYSFQELRAAIPAIVGDCTGGEIQEQNGDVVQPTTTGLLVRRAVDNWSEFTNGVNTWGIGPNGLTRRPNNGRFPWELAVPAPGPTAPPTSVSPTATPVYLTSGEPAPAGDMTSEGADTPTPEAFGTPDLTITPTASASASTTATPKASASPSATPRPTATVSFNP